MTTKDEMNERVARLERQALETGAVAARYRRALQGVELPQADPRMADWSKAVMASHQAFDELQIATNARAAAEQED